MTRRQQVENVIIGTLLESSWRMNYYDECRNVVSSDMFLDEDNQRIFRIIQEMNANGHIETDPCSIFQLYGEKVQDILVTMMDRVADCSFVSLKIQYNEAQWRAYHLCGNNPEYSEKTFADCVGAFLKYVYEDEEEGRKTAV